jgi:DNA-binding CsgD family transcriptional regulator
MNFASQVAEIALGTSSLQAFYTEFVGAATRALGAAGGGIFSSTRSGSGAYSSNLMDPKLALDSLLLGSADFSREEVSRAMAGGTVLDEQVFSSRRRDELPYFREVVRPLCGGRSVFCLKASQGAVSFYAFLPERRASFERFAERAVPLLDSAAPIVELAHKLFRQSQVDCQEALPRSLTRELRLTAAEHETMDLVLRGLTNPEIASVLGISVNTVRNRLSECFKKLQVSTRTESVFVLTRSVQLDTAAQPPLATYDNILQARRSAIHSGADAISDA